MGLLGDLIIADSISGLKSSNNTPSGIIKCAPGESKVEKHKKYMASLSEEEKVEYRKNERAKILLKELGKERYIKLLEKRRKDSIVNATIDEMGADRFNDLLLIEEQEARIEELELENQKLKEEKRPKRYIRRK